MVPPPATRAQAREGDGREKAWSGCLGGAVLEEFMRSFALLKKNSVPQPLNFVNRLF
jgi:hypothetical protein